MADGLTLASESNNECITTGQSDCQIDLRKLNQYYDGAVTIQRESKKKAVGIVIPIIRKILTYVNSSDPRFLRQEQCLGSYYQKLKVGYADEFDYSVLLNTGKHEFCIPQPQPYCTSDTSALKMVSTNVPLTQALPPQRYFTSATSTQEVVSTNVPLTQAPPPQPYCTSDTSTQKVVSTNVPLSPAPTGYATMFHSEIDKTGGPPITQSGVVIPKLVKMGLARLVAGAIKDLGLRGTIL
jgi:hypothetical protein